MKNIIFILCLLIPAIAFAGPPTAPRPKQVSSAEITTGTETALRSYSPANIKLFIDTHGGGAGYME